MRSQSAGVLNLATNFRVGSKLMFQGRETDTFLVINMGDGYSSLAQMAFVAEASLNGQDTLGLLLLSDGTP